MVLPPDVAVTASHSDPTESFEDRGLEEEVANGIGLAVEHFLGEVVDDEAVVTGKGLDEPADVAASL